MVYVIQEDGRKDLTPARRYGEIATLLPPGQQITFSAEHVYKALFIALAEFTSEDYLLLVGDPIAIGIVTAIVARLTGGKFKLLKWDRMDREYIPVNIAMPTF